MKTVYKYPFEVTDRFCINMTEFAEILSVQVQNEVPCLWAIVETTNKKIDYEFILHGTGHQFFGDEGKCIGTFQMFGGGLVFHLFQKS